ncbi:hypothetical protein [Roseibium sp.]|uniref:hypothetical protein n=1 Tax=Roseibium sp. TaxID=1936156 RepID=UPI003B51A02E
MTATLKDELSELKSASDKSKRRSRKKAPPEAAQSDLKASTDEDGQETEKLEELGQKLSDLVHSAEDDIRANPVAITLGAFALGVVVGAIIRR